MRTSERKEAGRRRIPGPGPSVLFLLVTCALLAGCASGDRSVQGLEPMAEGLTACLPDPPEGWTVEAMSFNSKTTDLRAGKIDAAVEYKQINGTAEMEIDIRTNLWCCWLVSHSGDLQKLTIQGRKAGLDARKNKALLYVSLKSKHVVIFEADNMPEAAQTVEDFASVTDFDCLEKHLQK